MIIFSKKMELWKYEKELFDKGFNYIGGTDEAGRGPLYGAVVAACVVLPKDFKLDGINDSKKLSEKKRKRNTHIWRIFGILRVFDAHFTWA